MVKREGIVPVMGLATLEVGFPVAETFNMDMPVGAKLLGVKLMGKASGVVGGNVAIIPHLLMLANPNPDAPKENRSFALLRSGMVLPIGYTYDHVGTFTYGKNSQLFYLFERHEAGEG